jgi:SAM-dependent methyltransferase
MPDRREIVELLRPIAEQYPDLPPTDTGDLADPRKPLYLERIAFDIALVFERLKRERPTVVDIGGGLGLFSAGAAALGARSILVDDNAIWREPDWRERFPAVAQIWERHRVEVVERDVIADGLGDAVDRFDAVTNFHFMEHVHASPKALFHDAFSRLTPGGVFAVAGPNAANLRKRLAAILGKTAWSPIAQWYEEPVFRGHVREPSVDDLEYIAHDLGMRDTTVVGRNFLGLASPHGSRRAAARALDYPLRLFPSLCSDLYLVGRKD